MHNFEKLKIWQKAMDVAVEVYEVSLLLPNDEKFNLIHQIKKCAVSIPSNIAEGSGRTTDNGFSRFIEIAISFSYELETQLILISELYQMNIKDVLTDLKSSQLKSVALNERFPKILTS